MLEQQSKKFSNKQGVSIVTNYMDAVHWLHNSYIMCNNLPEIDESIFENFRFDYYDENQDPTEVYQWFLCSGCESDIEYLEKRFGLKFTYSDKLDLFVLCVTHFGTSWDYVFNPDAEADKYWKDQIDRIETEQI
jgi:hypothetical protein